ncbi:DUF2634 domain-containing protein [Lysinibacillus xylanilyticus]|uniref:DUF2634 domain-containing protein n=1 Tax=Lysinibacillus xylanilyticus TaxID=582475 RepID=A0ABT4EMM3_9BACI|nr:DUF2634 domain-containing protein [Lysinibacillus xylanilyticus]MCY9546773.1 DUF2634 domain-containing protein [Lysinibacillus xylanilyticus]
MSLTPIEYEILAEEEDGLDLESEALPEIETSKTWRIDLENGRIGTFIDGNEAIRQYIRKVLITARNRYLIYDDTYGEELHDLIGQNLTKALMDVEIPRVVRDAIEGDDRIEEVSDVTVMQYNSDSILIAVTVITATGLFITEEVTL